MTDVFKDSLKFMTSSAQCVDGSNASQSKMYLKLIKEEYGELRDAVKAKDEVETLDALIDILVVTIGAIHSMGYDGTGAWNEVMRTNFAKIDPETGKCRLRDDGKILKPEGWKGPELAPFLTRSK